MISKVLVVDDSIVFRKILTESLSNQRGIRVVDACSNGKDALVKIRQLKPDVVVLDVEMPEMDGIQTLQEIKRQRLDVGVIMFSGLTQEGAQITFEALSKGAFDFVPKPSGSSNFYESVQKTRKELTERIKAYMENKLSRLQNKKSHIPTIPQQQTQKTSASSQTEPKTAETVECKDVSPSSPSNNIASEAKTVSQPQTKKELPERRTTHPIAISRLNRVSRSRLEQNEQEENKITTYHRPIPRVTFVGRIEAVAIGISTGGPNALSEVIPKFPANFSIPIFIVQHMPPVFTTQLAKRLDEKSPLKVVEAEDNMIVEQGTVYLAPGDYHMTVAVSNGNKVIKLNQDPPENSCRPAVDVLFRSIANVYGNRSIAVIMTGMGQDGFKGAKILKEKGAYIIAQDKESCVVWGMPRFVTEAGLADKICSLNEIASSILQISGALVK